MYGNTARAVQLINAGVEITGRKPYRQTSLMIGSNPTILTALIDSGADVSARSRDGKTVLMHADIHKRAKIRHVGYDPFHFHTTPDSIPDESQLSECITLEISAHGGHVGFISGGTPWRPEYYLPSRITDFLASQIAEPQETGHALPGL